MKTIYWWNFLLIQGCQSFYIKAFKWLEGPTPIIEGTLLYSRLLIQMLIPSEKKKWNNTHKTFKETSKKSVQSNIWALWPIWHIKLIITSPTQLLFTEVVTEKTNMVPDPMVFSQKFINSTVPQCRQIQTQVQKTEARSSSNSKYW